MNRDSKRRLTQGFTLVELTLSMGFVSFLLLAIAMTVIQIGNTYNRGITYKNVNQSGGLLAKELKGSINGGEPIDISGVNSRFIKQDWGGRLCTGQYSYVWNYGAYIAKTPRNTYTNSTKTIRFIKIYDPGSIYCSKNALGSYPSVNFNDAIELLDAGQHDLIVHDFTISSSPNAYDGNTMQQLYTVEFLIGTNNQNALKKDATGKVVIGCLEPSEKNADPIYCSVSRFRILARAGNPAE